MKIPQCRGFQLASLSDLRYQIHQSKIIIHHNIEREGGKLRLREKQINRKYCYNLQGQGLYRQQNDDQIKAIPFSDFSEKLTWCQQKLHSTRKMYISFLDVTAPSRKKYKPTNKQ
ncbi:hypothetical protein ABPG74_010171 [Tetrahymena malaccensis]